MVERRIEKEPFVVQLEMFFWLTDAALAERQKLLALGECPHGHGPFFESNRHREIKGETLIGRVLRAQQFRCNGSGRNGGDCMRDTRNRKTYLQIRGIYPSDFRTEATLL